MGCAQSLHASTLNEHSKIANKSHSKTCDYAYSPGGKVGLKPETGKREPKKDDQLSQKAITLRSAILIQKWYRRYKARLEARKIATWNIFTTLEYMNEQELLQMQTFFRDLFGVLTKRRESEEFEGNVRGAVIKLRSIGGNTADDLADFDNCPQLKIESDYKGPHISFPLTVKQLECLIEAFKAGTVLHANYVIKIIYEVVKLLKLLPNIVHLSTTLSKQVTICGDLHGRFDDLCIIFYKNGLPNTTNPYVFNGDLVDREDRSTETVLVLFCCMLINPNAVVINRGNHEDKLVNLRYGFTKEVLKKYKRSGKTVLDAFHEAFSWLPVATIVNKSVFIVHGGISQNTDLSAISMIDRSKFKSFLISPYERQLSPKAVQGEMNQLTDLFWSDPQSKNGSVTNVGRGAGVRFGPDITKAFLEKNNLKLLVRSHECVYEGYEYCQGNQVLTIFSASNYYAIGSNKGAYMKLIGPKLEPHFVQYLGSKAYTMTPYSTVSAIETAASKSLRDKLFTYKSELMEKFQQEDYANSEMIGIHAFCDILCDVTKLHLPWHMIAGSIAKCTRNEKFIYYKTLLDGYDINVKLNEQNPNFIEAIYKNSDVLESVFRFMDKDSSGFITLDEFEDTCLLLNRYSAVPFSDSAIRSIANTIDRNKDGCIDLNEFFEAFRIANVTI